jgi:hypothetical protein
MRLPIGTLMVNRGVITPAQLEQILVRQKATHRPFGEIAEELCGVKGKDVERAWAEQYAQTTRWVDPMLEPCDPAVHDLISRRQAWQFRVLPMGYDGSELMICTTQEGLVRAMNFAARQIPVTCYFVLSKLDQLAEALMRRYPMEGMSAETLAGENVAKLSPALSHAPSGGGAS